jgi:hypothetical protein
MRLVVSLVSTIGLAALLIGCGGSSKPEETTPAATGEEAGPPEETEGAQPEGESGSEGGEAEQPPEQAEQPEQPSSGGW